MAEEKTNSAAVEDTSMRLIRIEAIPSSCECENKDHVAEESSSVHSDEAEKDVGLLLSKQLDGKGFCEGIVFIWSQWNSRPYTIKVKSFGWTFKLILWFLR